MTNSFVVVHTGAEKSKKQMSLLDKYKIKLRHPRSVFLIISPARELKSKTNTEKITIAEFKKQTMNLTPSTTETQFTWTKWEGNQSGILKSIKDFFADLFADKDYLQKKEQFMLIKELQLKTFELEHLKRELVEKNDLLKKMSYHQSHTVRRPLANILGITKLIHAYIKEHPDADLSQLISFLQLSSDELDDAIKNNG